MRESLEWECRRATLFLRIFCGLDATQRTCLSALLTMKAKVRFFFSSSCSQSMSRYDPSCQSLCQGGRRIPKDHKRRQLLKCNEPHSDSSKVSHPLWLQQKKRQQYFPSHWRSCIKLSRRFFLSLASLHIPSILGTKSCRSYYSQPQRLYQRRISIASLHLKVVSPAMWRRWLQRLFGVASVEMN